MYSLPFFGIIGGVSLGVIESYITSLNTNLWLDGADPTKIGICQADTTFVCQWTDKSGKGNHATQSNNNSQPNYIDNRVSFTSTRFLSITNRQIFAGAISGSVFIVGRQPTTTAGAWGRFSANTTNQTNTPDSTGNTFREGFLSPSSVATLTPSGRTPTIPLPWSILNFVHSGNQLTFRENGALDLPTGSSTANTFSFGIPSAVATTQRLGGVTGDFDIYEVLMFPSVLSTSDRQIIEGYLAHKWGLTNLLPANHPYKTSLQGAFNTSFFSVRANEPFLPVSLPTLAIAATDATKPEGNTGTTAFTFTVTRSGNTANISSVSWAVTGTGTNPANAADFVGGVFPSGTLTLATGITSGLITVNVQGDTEVEQDEQFTVTLSNPVNATITTATAIGTIQNDDTADLPPGIENEVVFDGVLSGAFIRNLAVDNSNNLFVSSSAEVSVFSISNRTNPTLVGSYNYLLSQAIDIVGNYAYAASGSGGLEIINISAPASPTFVSNYNTSGFATDVQVVGNYAYVTNDNLAGGGGLGLRIIDISNPANPLIRGNYVGNTSNTMSGVHIVGSYAYVARGLSGLEIINISDPFNPAFTSNYDTPGFATDVQVVGNYAYVADGNPGLQIINISNPANPILTGNYTPGGFVLDVQVVGNYAYVLAIDLKLLVIDITNPSSPSLNRTYTMPNNGITNRSFTIVNDYAYVGSERGIYIINLTVNPNA